jgi:CBS domain-containing protein
MVVESMELKEIMVRNVVTVDFQASVREAAKQMNLYEIGCLIVMDKDNVVGILTERDLLTKVLEASKNAEKTKVKDIMSTKLVTGTSDMEVVDAARLMLKRKIKKLPIVDKGKLIGLVTFTDIVRTVRIEPGMMNTIREFSREGLLAPKSMRTLIEVYTT